LNTTANGCWIDWIADMNSCERCIKWLESFHPPLIVGDNWGVCSVPLPDGRIVKSHRDYSSGEFVKTRITRDRSEKGSTT
jgi:hypothetical protein